MDKGLVLLFGKLILAGVIIIGATFMAVNGIEIPETFKLIVATVVGYMFGNIESCTFATPPASSPPPEEKSELILSADEVP